MTTRYTGHRLSGDDLNTGTPSVERVSAKFSGYVKKPLFCIRGLKASPFHMSWILPSFRELLRG